MKLGISGMTKSRDQQWGVLVGTGTTSVAAAAPSAPSGCQACRGEKLAGQCAVPLPLAPRVSGYLMPPGESDWHGQECSYTVSPEEPAVCPIFGRCSSVSSAPSNVEVKEVRRVWVFATSPLTGLPPHPSRLGGRGRRPPRRVSVSPSAAQRGERRAALGVTEERQEEGWMLRGGRGAPGWGCRAAAPRGGRRPRGSRAPHRAGRRLSRRWGGGRWGGRGAAGPGGARGAALSLRARRK